MTSPLRDDIGGGFDSLNSHRTQSRPLGAIDRGFRMSHVNFKKCPCVLIITIFCNFHVDFKKYPNSNFVYLFLQSLGSMSTALSLAMIRYRSRETAKWEVVEKRVTRVCSKLLGREEGRTESIMALDPLN